MTNVLVSGQTLTGTDLELRVNAPLPGASFDAVLPYQRLKAIVANAGVDTMTFAVEDSRCRITAGGGQWVLPTESVDEYPAVKRGKATPIARLPADQFTSLVSTVIDAAAKNYSRYTGVQIEFKAGELVFAATDGKRLAVAKCDIDQATDDASALVPARAVESMLAAAASCDVVQLETTGKEFVATLDAVQVSTPLLEAAFPKWRLVEPDHSTRPTTAIVGELLAACRMAAVCSSETSRGVCWTVGENGITLRAKSAEFGESAATCSVVEGGDACTFTIAPAYAINWLRTLDPAESVSIEAKDADSAILLRDEDGDRRVTIMPLAGE